MPRVLSRSVLREINRDQLMPLEVLEVSVLSPFTEFQYHFINNIEPVTLVGKVYAPVAFSRGNYESESDEAVDRVTIQMDDVNKSWARSVQRNVIQGSRIRLRKAFMGYTTKERDLLTIFDGFIGAPSFDDPSFSVEIRSVVAYQETELPTRTFQPNCPYGLGSVRCGVDMSLPSNTVQNVVASSESSKGRIYSTALSAFQTRYFEAGYVYAESGPNQGQIRPIRFSSVAKNGIGYVDLFLPFSQLTEGGIYRVVRGCRKLKADCDDRYQNRNAAGALRYGGFAEVPRTPAVEIAAT